jgi:oligopeptidase A
VFALPGGGDGQNTDELREAKAEAQPLIVECSNKAAQSYSIYSGAKKIAENPAMWASLSEAQQRIVRSTMLNAELGGVALTGEAKDRFNAIALEEVSGAELLVSGWKRCTALTALLA